MAQEFKYAELTNAQIHFLDSYIPENRDYTTIEETKQIVSQLNLDKKSNIEELRATRNSVVVYYSNRMRHTDDTLTMAAHNSLKSITSVVDNYMYRIDL